MSRKNKKQKQKETTIEDFYDLKTKEMDELVSALKGEEEFGTEAPTTDIGMITGDEKEVGKNFNPYKLDKLSRVPTVVKALFIKWWFAGMCCFLFVMGLQHLIQGENLIWVNGIMMGVVVDVLVNPCLRYFDDDTKKCNNYMMFPFPFKKFWTFFANVAYSVVVMWGVNFAYMGISRFLESAMGSTKFGMEPLLFGVFYVVIDMAFIGVKDGIVYGVKKSKRKKQAALEAELAAQAAQQAEVVPEPVKPEIKSAEASALDRVTAEVLDKKRDGSGKKSDKDGKSEEK